MPPIRRARPLRRPALALALAALACAAPAAAQGSVAYEVSFPNAAHHEAEVVATFAGVPRGRPLQVRMSRSSPGRYALHEFAKNVYAVRATDGAGRPLEVTRPDPYGWEVAGHDGTVRFAYTLFGDRGDGTYAQVDATHAHLNGPATWAWARGMEQAPVRVAVRPASPEWTVATQLVPTADSLVFTAPDLPYLLDSPVEVGPVRWRTWQVPGGARPTTVRVAMHHLGTEAELDAYAAAARRILDEQVALFGAMPADFGTYTFLVDYLPWVSGDGMEHRNSTVVTSTRPLATSLLGNLGTLSHEAFHFWNVERMRPASLEPFDFERANMSGELWFAEGFTSYYDDLFIRRAGLRSDDEYAAGLSGTVNAALNAPGTRYHSPVEMSMQAPFVDAAASIDPQNRHNTYLSYYTGGAGLGLALDLALRARPGGVTLDDYVRAVWREFGAQAPGETEPVRGYTVADLERVLGETAGDPAFAAEFFRRYVRGRETPDFAALLERAGMVVRPARPGEPWTGRLEPAEGGGAEVATRTLVGSPLYGAGLDEGDRILTLAGEAVAGPADVERVARARPLGTALPIEYEQRGRRVRGTITFAEDPTVEVVTLEQAGRTPSAAQRRFRAAWLGSRAGGRP